MALVTCLHGFSQHGDSWEELASLVHGRYRWLMPDVRGTSLEQVTSEIVELWDSEGVDRSHLVGYSQGGRVALHLACQHPERVTTLTTIGAHAGLEGAERVRRLTRDQELADRIEREGVSWFAEYWAELPLFAGLARRGPAFLARLDAGRRQNDPAHLAASLRGLGAGATPPFWHELGRVTAPALLLAGAEDTRYVDLARRLAGCLPRATVAIVPDAGHAAHLEQPEAGARLLGDHLSTR